MVSKGRNRTVPRKPLPQQVLDLGDHIRVLRMQRGLSQHDIEEKTGILSCNVSRIESGNTVPSLDTLTKIVRAMNMNLSQFFSSGGDRYRRPRLSTDDESFLSQLREYVIKLNETDRRTVLRKVKSAMTEE